MTFKVEFCLIEKKYLLEFFHPLEHFFILSIGQIIIVISSMPWVERVKPNPRTTIGYRTEQLFWTVHMYVWLIIFNSFSTEMRRPVVIINKDINIHIWSTIRYFDNGNLPGTCCGNFLPKKLNCSYVRM